MVKTFQGISNFAVGESINWKNQFPCSQKYFFCTIQFQNLLISENISKYYLSARPRKPPNTTVNINLHKSLSSGTPLIRSPMGKKNVGRLLTGDPINEGLFT